MRDHSSKIRQQLRSLALQHDSIIQRLLLVRGGLIRGVFGTRKRRCGNPSCRCTTQGQLHVSKYLAASLAGTTKQVHVPVSDEVMVAQGTERYRQWLSCRAEIVQLVAQELALIDQLLPDLLTPYPKDSPLPPAQKRGPKPRTRA